MILSDKSIRWFIEIDELVIQPIPKIIQPTSVDLRLGTQFITDRGERVELTETQSYIMNPGEFLLAATAEWIEIPRFLVGILTGKSTLARLGLQVEAAGYVDPGWKGNLTLELKNLSENLRMVIHPGMRIAQIRFEQCEEPTKIYGDPGLSSHYQESNGPVEADRRGLFDPLDQSDPVRE